MSVTRHLPQANNVVELTRTFNRVWDAINSGESERRQAVDQIRSSVSGLNDRVDNMAGASFNDDSMLLINSVIFLGSKFLMVVLRLKILYSVVMP